MAKKKHRWEIHIKPGHMGAPGAVEGSGVTYGVFVDASEGQPIKLWTEDEGVMIVGDGWGGHAALQPRTVQNYDSHALITQPTRLASTVPYPVLVHAERADRPTSEPPADPTVAIRRRARVVEDVLNEGAFQTHAEKQAAIDASRKAA